MTTTVRRRRETVYLYQGDDLDRLTELSAAAADAQAAEKAAGSSRLLCDTTAQDATAAYNEFRAEARERATPVVVEALGRVAWRDLVRAHPPREQTIDDDGTPVTVLHDEDQSGVNADTFPDALVPASIVEPTFDSDEERAAFADDLSDADFWRLYGVAWVLNRSAADPKALPVYDVTPESVAT
jgi:hypothetical protein